MIFKKVAKRVLSVLLAGTLVMSTGAPVNVLAEEVLDLNEIVSVDTQNYIIDLNGTSVVVMPLGGSSNAYSQIFPDYNGDKLPDNQIPLKIDGQTSYNLKKYELRGYSDPSKPFEGDISITLSGGNIKNVYGIYGTENAPVSVNGDVKLYLEGVNASSGNAITSYYGKAENVMFSFTKTLNDNVKMYAAYESQIAGDVDFAVGGQAQIRGTSDATHAMIGVTKGSTIEGDVNVDIGFESSTDGFLNYNIRYYYTDFSGVVDTKVMGSINYNLDGIWTPGSSVFVQGSTVEKDVNIQAVSTDLTVMSGNNDTVMVMDSTINGNLNFSGDAQTGLTSRGSITLLKGTSAETKTTVKGNLYVDIPKESISRSWTGIGNNAVVEGAIYSNVAGSIAIDTVGSTAYTIAEDVDGKRLVIYEDANVVIAEGVSVELSQDLDLQTGAKLVNNGSLSLKLENRSDTNGTVAGIIENNGSLSTDYKSDKARGHLKITSAGLVINEKNATWNVGCYVDNQGKIVNHGSFVQTYSYESGENYYYAKLGKLFTTMPLTLSRHPNTGMLTHTYDSINKKYNSEVYYAINVVYPPHCAATPSLTGTQIVSSGISGDTNQYIRVARVGDGVTSDFTLTPGAPKGENFTLEKVTYGADNKQIEATETASGKVYTASVLGEFAPITITLDYGEGGKVTPITLDKSSDSIAGLAVDQGYTQNKPLYDLTGLTIIGDIAWEGGNVVYTHTSGQLPEGIVFEDGKLYGTFKEACGTETVLTFTITGLNLTTAEFTLTLAPVKKAVPKWSLPTGFVGKVGQMVVDVQLPKDSRGEYTWETETQSLDRVGFAVTNIIFTPNAGYSVDNYDWAQAAGDAWDEENGRIYWPVQIEVVPGELAVTAPTGLTAVYGQTFADVSLPSDENGTFTWDTDHHALSDKVGDVGEHICYVTYWPADENYTEKSGIEVTLTVSLATPVYEERLSQIEVLCDEELGDVLFPDVDGGRYQWVSATSIKPKDQGQYSVIFLPDDIANYDWTVMDGWDSDRKGVVFSVKVTLDHAWDEGVVTKPATTDETGIKTYTCGLCEVTREETIDKLAGDTGDSDNGSSAGGGEDSFATEPENGKPQVGYTLSDKKSKAVYKVSAIEKEVTYVKPLKKTYTKVEIPSTIKYDGVTYKVTAIANNACKNNAKLKTVTIGTNVKAIGSKAFYGCKKLLKMTIKTTKLTEKEVGKQAFTKMGSSNYKKVTVKVPKKKLKAYRKMLQKRGLSKKAKVKK